MAASSFQINEHIGWLTTFVILVALICDLLLLPSLILMIKEKTNMTKFSLALIVFSQVVATGAVAQSAAEKGRQIVLKSTDSSGGYKTSSASGEMALRSANGKVSKRRFYTKSIEGSGSEGTKSLLVFEWPGDIRNTGLLTHARKNASDRQWLFLPSIRRVKKISSSGRSGSFVGSEFSYQGHGGSGY